MEFVVEMVEALANEISSWHLSLFKHFTFANIKTQRNCSMRRFTSPKRATNSLFKSSFAKPFAASFHITRPSLINPGVCVQGESGRQYRLLSPLSAQVSETHSNVWKAVDGQDESLEFIIKGPSHDDNASLDWPPFPPRSPDAKALQQISICTTHGRLCTGFEFSPTDDGASGV